jgi:hypothetical protein
MPMPTRPSKLKELEDTNTLAARIVAQATGQTPATPPAPAKNPAAVALGRLGASKGGQARAKNLSPARRKAIARKAAQSRWGK